MRKDNQVFYRNYIYVMFWYIVYAFFFNIKSYLLFLFYLFFYHLERLLSILHKFCCLTFLENIYLLSLISLDISFDKYFLVLGIFLDSVTRKTMGTGNHENQSQFWKAVWYKTGLSYSWNNCQKSLDMFTYI